MYRQMWRANPHSGCVIEIVREDDGYAWTTRTARPMMLELEDDVEKGKASSLRQAKKEAEQAAASAELTELQKARLKVRKAQRDKAAQEAIQAAQEAEQAAEANAEERMRKKIAQYPWLFGKETT